MFELWLHSDTRALMRSATVVWSACQMVWPPPNFCNVAYLPILFLLSLCHMSLVNVFIPSCLPSQCTDFGDFILLVSLSSSRCLFLPLSSFSVCLPFSQKPPSLHLPPVFFPLPAVIHIPPSLLSLSLCQFPCFLHAFVYLSRCLLLTLEVIRDPWAAIPECWAG